MIRAGHKFVEWHFVKKLKRLHYVWLVQPAQSIACHGQILTNDMLLTVDPDRTGNKLITFDPSNIQLVLWLVSKISSALIQTTALAFQMLYHAAAVSSYNFWREQLAKFTS